MEKRENEGGSKKNCCEPYATKTSTAQAIFIHQMLKNIVKLALAPSGDEILPVRSQEPADQCLPDEKQNNKLPSVPLGMESILPTQN